MSHGAHETEIKLGIADVETGKRLLYRAGFRVYKRRVFEDNTVFDTPGLKLRHAESLLRLREAGKRAILTYKGKPIASKHKSREELEIDVSSAAMLRAIVERLGFEPVFRYQKHRTEYKQRARAGVATLDETPIGTYLELEGPPSWIDHTAHRLGYSETDYITTSYAGLYQAWRKRHKSAPRDMIW